jgi:hypothetical protein
MTSTAGPLRSSQQPNGSAGCPAETTVRLVPPDTGPLPGGPCRAPATVPPATADPARGTGLRGLADRVETLGGTLKVTSGRGRGTRLTAAIPTATSWAD